MANEDLSFDDVNSLKNHLKKKDENYVLKSQELEGDDEYSEFYFIGNYLGKDVVVDAAIFTLRLYHQSELYDRAEQKVAGKIPEFGKIVEKGIDLPSSGLSEEKKEEISILLADIMDELEEEGTIKVNEFVETAEEHDQLIVLEGAFYVDEINHDFIQKFIDRFNKAQGDPDKMNLDKTVYTFQED